MDYTYMNLETDLNIGHEIHFVYRSIKYSISRNKDGWYLSKFDKEYQTFKNPQELLSNGTIEGQKLKDVWVDVEVTDIF